MVRPATRARPAAGRSRKTAATPLRHRAGVAADPPTGRKLPAPELRRAQQLAPGLRGERAPLSQPGRPNLRHHLQSRAPLVLVAAHAARGGAGVQSLRLFEGRPRPLVRPYRFRGPDLAAQCAAAREHRNPHTGVFLKPSTTQPRRRELRGCARRLLASPTGLLAVECELGRRCPNGAVARRLREAAYCGPRFHTPNASIVAARDGANHSPAL